MHRELTGTPVIVCLHKNFVIHGVENTGAVSKITDAGNGIWGRRNTLYFPLIIPLYKE